MEQFIDLYEGVYKDLYRLAYYYLGDAQEAEDAVGETALKAWENFGKLRDYSAFRNWIFKILVNQCNTQLRKKILYRASELSEEPSYEPVMEDHVITGQMLSVLNEEERKIVVLTVLGGYKGEEIARLLKRPHSTIRSRYRRALKKLEQAMKEEKMQDEK